MQALHLARKKVFFVNPPLTNDELNLIKESPNEHGCFSLLENRCIKGIDFENRPIHLVDQ